MTARKAAKEVPPAVAIDRELGLRGSFKDFVKMAWHVVEHDKPFVDGWHIGAICEHIEAVSSKQIRQLAISVPPGCMKSLTVSVFWPAWQWIRDPGYRFICGSFDRSLVGRRDGGKVIELVSSEWYRARWREVLIRGKEPSTEEFYTTKGGMRFASSIGGRVTGRHAHAFVIDDPIKPQGMTELALAEALRWKQETTASRLFPKGVEVIIMQRLHENDLVGHMEREGGWDFLRLPMRYEEATKCTTSIGFADPREKEGELLWPEYKDEEEVSRIEKGMGGAQTSTVAAQLQQRPAPAKGLLFSKDHFKRYTVLPARIDFVVDSWDLTFKDAESSDYVVGQRWAKSGAGFYLLSRVRGRWNFPRTISEIRAFRVQAGLPNALATLVEDKANGPAVIATLEQEIPGLIAVNPEGGKVVRAQAITPLYEAGQVYHPDLSIAPWIEEHEAELLRFPKGANDDSVDAETQALTYLRSKASSFAAAMDALGEKGTGWIFN